MSRWSDIAEWRGTPNVGGAMQNYRGVVLHIAEGSYEGTISWCQNPEAEVSAHFVVSKTGQAAQLVDTATQSWCQSAGNPYWISIENEGHGGDALTDAQVQACARILGRAHQEHGIPLQLANTPSQRGLGYHSMGGDAWGGHYGCPGPRIIAQRTQIIARAEALVGEESLMATTNEKIDAMMMGFPSTPDGDPVCPTRWQIATEKWQAGITKKIDELVPTIDYAALAKALLDELASRAGK